LWKRGTSFNDSIRFFYGDQLAAEKPEIFGESDGNTPQVLKPHVYFVALAARLKSCPFKAEHNSKLGLIQNWA